MDINWKETDTIIVAVSGGIDSVVLLHNICQKVNKKNIVVAHVNHGMRQSAKRDCLFVEQLAVRYGLFFETNNVSPKLFNENEARIFRYQFLEKVANKYGAKYVLTAHHQDDQVETFLWRLMRGDGVNGLLGMPQYRWLSDTVTLCRPLLSWSKAKILDYAKEHQLEHVEDETNVQPIYTRNRLRQNVLPLLRKEQKRFDTHVMMLQNELSDMLCVVEDVLLQSPYVVEGVINLSEFRKLPQHSQRVLLSRWLINADQPIKYVDAIMLLAQQSNGQKQLSLNGGWLYVQTYDKGQVILPIEKTTPQIEVIQQFPYMVNGYEIVVDEKGLSVDESELPLVVRGVEQGDKMSVAVGTKKVSRLLIDAKIPREERLGLSVLATTQKRVLAILDKRFENLYKTQETGKIRKYNQIIITIRKATEK